MKRTVILILIGLISVSSFAQREKDVFKAYLYNDEYEVYLRINFYDKNVKIPGQELYGDLPGYLGRKNHSFCWVMVSSKVESEQKATMTMVNDFGSEDLIASLTCINDSTYIFRQEKGSTVKIPKNGKWQKLPKTLKFKRK
ncbi:MAG: hypothetical protein J6Y46_04590 [Prevotella sp.]|nr:hypothetical protein [Prevotella sp.]